MKKNKLLVVALILISILAITSFVYADGFDFGSAVQDAQNFGKAGGESVIKSGDIANVIKPIVNVGVAIGTFVIIALGIVLGINYITGGAEKQAECKKQGIGLVVSAVVIWGAYGIWSAVYTILDKVVK